MKYSIVPVTPLQQNCTLLWCGKTGEGAVLDPGGEIERILERAREQGIAPTKILLTHTHIDHAGGAGDLAALLGIPIEGPHRDDRPWVDALKQQSAMFGLPAGRPFVPDRWLVHGDRVTVGREELEVIHCPGHTPGHLVFYHARDRLALVGDVLFQGSIGRTDFPFGDHTALLRSIRERLWPLGDDVRFIPGHGPMSSFGAERRSNPFVRD
jgi:glyoxylase-like metal-dependent hydrolase (beta-lactamase superfamily II)